MDNPLEAGSPPPSQLDEEAPRPLPSLPTEILQRIIQLALPRLSFNTFPERYNILLTCCRVNKLWAALAQMELTPHVWITENNTVQQHFLPAFKMGDRPALRSLWLQDEAATDVPALLATGQSIPRLYVSSDEPLLTLQVIDLLQISQREFSAQGHFLSFFAD
ncbi:hypothetical protein BCR35DRAFT_5313 [Leucosporidium creatinivorum]|uniref:F-box domain-containing protein n=1 Tax=Leucosporidium creatinivorum TaxID=106004 RepID=A0A1Y2G3X1_9BASI|nr:hypothetical protein BCR35DRAFT_5313 [Leucosporidium creatinivorum]